MASALSATSVSAALLQKPCSGSTVKFCSPSVVVGLPALKAPKITCSASKAVKEEKKTFLTNGNIGLSAAAMSVLVSSPAFALVDERLSTEGTGLSLGLSNPTLGWILVGVFTLIWSLYFIYTTTLDEDEESGGLSL